MSVIESFLYGGRENHTTTKAEPQAKWQNIFTNTAFSNALYRQKNKHIKKHIYHLHVVFGNANTNTILPGLRHVLGRIGREITLGI